MDYTPYVAGFLFSNDLQNVVLIQKLRPVFMQGKLNGLGGKINPDEAPLGAMRREFYEEAGIDIRDWSLYTTLSGNHFSVDFFRATHKDVKQARTMTDEKVIIVPVNELHRYSLLPNVQWLIHMALSFYQGETCRKFYTHEIYGEV